MVQYLHHIYALFSCMDIWMVYTLWYEKHDIPKTQFIIIELSGIVAEKLKGGKSVGGSSHFFFFLLYLFIF